MPRLAWLSLLSLFCLPVLASRLTLPLPGFPKALLHYAGNDEPSDAIDYYVFEPLLRMSPRDRRPEAVLAEKWTVSPDHLRYTFRLRKEARFSDGRPVTAEDVVATWQALQNPRYPFPPARAFFSSFKACEKLGPREVVFTATRAHFKNLEKLSDFLILPKDAAGLDTPYPPHLLGSGPYQIAETKLGEAIVLKRNANYRGKRPAHFDEIVFRAIADPQTQLEFLRQGTLDAVYFYVAKLWATETDDAAFRAGKLKKLVVKSHLPFGTAGIYWNLRRPLFSDVKVRRALAMLLDRPKLLHDLFYDSYRLSTGVVPPDSPWHDPRNQPLKFDPGSARALLRESGWRELGADGILRKDGQPFSFEVLAKEPAAERFLTRYAEALRAQGIEMKIRISDWATVLRRVDARDFDGALLYRSRDAEPSDFALAWGSEYASVPGSDNFCGFSDPLVDRLARELDQTFDAKKRVRLARRLDYALAQNAPIAFSWEPEELRFAYSSRLIIDEPPPYARWYQIFAGWRESEKSNEKARR